MYYDTYVSVQCNVLTSINTEWILLKWFVHFQIENNGATSVPQPISGSYVIKETNRLIALNMDSVCQCISNLHCRCQWNRNEYFSVLDRMKLTYNFLYWIDLVFFRPIVMQIYTWECIDVVISILADEWRTSHIYNPSECRHRFSVQIPKMST